MRKSQAFWEGRKEAATNRWNPFKGEIRKTDHTYMKMPERETVKE